MLGIPEIPAEVIACLPSAILGFVSRDGTVGGVARCDSRGGSRQSRHRNFMNGAASMGSPRARWKSCRLMQQGVSNKTISRELGIELSTVKNHVHSILAKLGVHRRGEAISLLYAHEKAAGGWDVLPPIGRADADDIDDELPPEACWPDARPVVLTSGGGPVDLSAGRRIFDPPIIDDRTSACRWLRLRQSGLLGANELRECIAVRSEAFGRWHRVKRRRSAHISSRPGSATPITASMWATAKSCTTAR